MWELFSVWVWAASFLEHGWHLPKDSVPYLAFMIISMGVPGSFLGGMLGDRLGRITVAATSLAVSGACVVGLGLLADTGPLFIRIGIFILWGLTALADSPQFSVIITIHAKQEHVGTAITLQMLCGYLITMLALWVVPWLAARLSWSWAFFSLAVGPASGLLSLLLLSYTSHQRDGETNGQALDAVPIAPALVAPAAEYGRPTTRRLSI